MADIKQLKSKIQATNNIKKITNALEIISTLKLQKVKKGTIHIREGMLALLDIIVDIDKEHTLFSHASHTLEKDCVIVIGSEKGLCGSLNTTLFKYMHTHFGNNKDTTDVYVVGKKTKEYFQRRGYQIEGEAFIGDSISLGVCHTMIHDIETIWQSGKYRHIYICYNIFKNTMKYIPVIFPLYPLKAQKIRHFLHDLKMGDLERKNHPVHINNKHVSALHIEPSAEEIRKTLYAMMMHYVLYGAVMQNKTCEFAARMLAMKGAKDNATNQIGSITLAYNKARQDNITKEIIEIAGAKSLIAA